MVSSLFVVITALFVTTLLTANIIAVKVVDLFGLVLPAGIVIFPLSYIFGDILTEVYGYRQARRVIWLGFFCNLLLVASFLAYLAGEFANAYVLARLKVLTRGRFLWTRTIGSTLVGQGLDSLVFITVAFLGTPGMALAPVILTQWAAKCLYEALATPFTYLVVNWLKRVEGLDAFDVGIDFNPLAITR